MATCAAPGIYVDDTATAMGLAPYDAGTPLGVWDAGPSNAGTPLGIGLAPDAGEDAGQADASTMMGLFPDSSDGGAPDASTPHAGQDGG